MGAVLMLAWSLLDFSLEPGHARTFLLLRACVLVLEALFCAVLTRTQSVRVVRTVAAASIISAWHALSAGPRGRSDGPGAGDPHRRDLDRRR